MERRDVNLWREGDVNLWIDGMLYIDAGRSKFEWLGIKIEFRTGRMITDRRSSASIHLLDIYTQTILLVK